MMTLLLTIAKWRCIKRYEVSFWATLWYVLTSADDIVVVISVECEFKACSCW